MSEAPGEQEIKAVWSEYWSGFDEIAPWDSLSEVVLWAVEQEWLEVPGNGVLEAGCGTGRISHRLALAGADVTCLDITQEALDHAQQVFGTTKADFVLGSILEMPRDTKSDLIWNSGVMEHFKPEDQMQAISEFLASLNPGGKVVLLTPYSRSLLYRLGKFTLELLGRWPYGVEIPKETLADIIPPEGQLEREYTVSFLPLFFDSYKFLKPLKAPLKFFWQKLLKWKGREKLMRWDAALSRLFGGYLLVSVILERHRQP